MRILLVAATAMELSGVVEHITSKGSKQDFFNIEYAGHSINTLVTGIGSVATTYGISQILAQEQFDLIINIGLAGSYDLNISLGSVYYIAKDRFGDLGSLDRDEKMLDIYDLKLADADQFPYTDGWLIPTKTIENISLPSKSSITLNTTSGSPTSIMRFKDKYGPDLESMEGAAVFYIAMMKDVEIIQVRAVSNYVTLRDRESWQIPLALAELTKETIKIIDAL